MLVMKSSAGQAVLGEQVRVVVGAGQRHAGGERAALAVPVGEADEQRHQDRQQQEQPEDHDDRGDEQPAGAALPAVDAAAPVRRAVPRPHAAMARSAAGRAHLVTACSSPAGCGRVSARLAPPDAPRVSLP